MEESILDSIKKMLGVDAECISFDQEIIMFINSAFSTLYQVGYTEAHDFVIEGRDEKWMDLGSDNNLLQLVKTYIYSKVRMLFDPPSTSFVLESLNNQIKELEWRIYVQSEGGFDNVC